MQVGGKVRGLGKRERAFGGEGGEEGGGAGPRPPTNRGPSTNISLMINAYETTT